MSYMDDVSNKMGKYRQKKAKSTHFTPPPPSKQHYSNTMTEVGRPSTKDKTVLEIQRLKEARNKEVAANKPTYTPSLTPKTPFRDRVITDSKPSSDKTSLKNFINVADKETSNRRKNRKKQIRTVIRAGTDGTKSHYGKSGHSRRFPPFKGLNNKEYQINA